MPGGLDLQLSRLLRDEHGISVAIRTDAPDRPGPKRTYDPAARVLTLARRLTPGQRAFQLATQLAFLTQARAIDVLLDRAESLPEQSRPVARIGLANYFAGALILPYTPFLAAAEGLRYDIDLLSAKFEVGFVTVCYRLSTLQRRDFALGIGCDRERPNCAQRAFPQSGRSLHVDENQASPIPYAHLP